MKSPRVFSLLALAGTVCSISPAFGQLPPGLPIAPENFASTHFWGGPSVVNIRHLSMGGAFAADNREGWHGNPAGMVAIREPTLVLAQTSSRFALLPTFRSPVYGAAVPIGRDGREVIKVAVVPVRASGQIAVAAPVRVEAKEDDIGVEYARRVNRRLCLGFSTAYLRTQSSYRIDGAGVVTTLRSRPSGPGGRVGIIHDLGERASIGLTYDNYSETVTRTAPALQLPERAFRFRSRAYRVGVALRPGRDTTVLADYESLHLSGNRTEVARHGFLVGLERRLGPVALRLGSYDGRLSGGIGLRHGKIELSYGFTGRYASNLPGRGARTAHAFQVTRRL
jgi:hypothetical protein